MTPPSPRGSLPRPNAVPLPGALRARDRAFEPREHPDQLGKALCRPAPLCANNNYNADKARLQGCVMLLIEKRKHQNNAPVKITPARC
jgi:hypothetical protein